MHQNDASALDKQLQNRAGETWLPGLIVASAAPQLLPENDRLSAVLGEWRGSSAEGLFVAKQNGELDPNATFAVACAALLRNDAKTVVQNLYALLLHTSASHLVIGERVAPWGDRQEHGGITPLTPFGARLIALLRDMLIREEGRDLHLFSALSPAWLNRNDEITLTNAVTKFGRISFKATVQPDRLIIDFNQQWQHVPRFLIFHAPEFAQVQNVLVDRQAIDPQAQTFNLSPHARRVEIIWNNEASRQNLSLATAVADFKNEYRGRHHLWKSRITK
jgi:hypothetical protein